jgi:cell division protein FtsL
MNGKKLFRTIIILFAAIYVGWTIISQQIDIHNNNKLLAEYDQKIAAELQRRQQLEKEKELINTPEYIERIAREEIGMVKPDETVFVDILKGQ